MLTRIKDLGNKLLGFLSFNQNGSFQTNVSVSGNVAVALPRLVVAGVPPAPPADKALYWDEEFEFSYNFILRTIHM